MLDVLIAVVCVERPWRHAANAGGLSQQMSRSHCREVIGSRHVPICLWFHTILRDGRVKVEKATMYSSTYVGCRRVRMQWRGVCVCVRVRVRVCVWEGGVTKQRAR
jgi:hypothetical protein